MTVKATRIGLALMLGALAAIPASGQDVIHYRADAAGGVVQGGVSVIALDPVSIGATVTDAPYSAEGITEVTQTLADGNRIERRTTTTIARASDGRTRREQQGFAIGNYVGRNAQPIVTITDPTSGVHITLNYDLKVAFRMKPGWVSMAGSPDERGAVGPGQFLSRGAVIAGDPPSVSTGRRGMPAPSPLPPLPPPPGGFDERVLAFEAAALPWEGEKKTEQLEARTIEGLRAEGTRTTMTVPAGAVGNALPIDVVSERWFSPELQVVLMTRRADPRFGETVYRLTNIVRSEPSADLFEVPPDFRIEHMKPNKP
jgi:hypothetical protein